MKASLKDVLVKSLMSFPVKTFSANAQIRAVAQLFVAQKINSGLVMQNNEIVGIITSGDLLRVFAESSMLDAEIKKWTLATWQAKAGYPPPCRWNEFFIIFYHGSKFSHVRNGRSIFSSD